MGRKRTRSSHGETYVSNRTVAPRPFRAPTPAKNTSSHHTAPASRPARLFQAPATFSSSSSITRPKAKPGTRQSPARSLTLFNAPPAALICLKRSQRKQVLHAIGKAGKRGQKRPRYTLSSKVKCP